MIFVVAHRFIVNPRDEEMCKERLRYRAHLLESVPMVLGMLAVPNARETVEIVQSPYSPLAFRDSPSYTPGERNEVA